jgi:N-acetylneuraminate synthase
MNNKTYIIAEAGVNHNGSVTMAKELIDVAADCGADAVKFQTFKAEKIVGKTAEKAAYQQQTTEKTESQYDMIKRLELGEAAHRELLAHCVRRNIRFLSTPFDGSSLQFLTEGLNLPYIKIASGEITNAPFLLEVAKTNKPVILSTGMSTLGEIETALGVLSFGYLQCEEQPGIAAFQRSYASRAGQAVLQLKVSLLHCTTEYPASFSEVNLRAMDTLRNAFQLPVGLSDHTQGIAVAIAAAARGAAIVEKHFTLDRSLPGPDHKASLEPDELKVMVASIRQVEAALGSASKIPSPAEYKNQPVARKSLVADTKIKKGEKFTVENLAVKRPGNGVQPIYYWDFIGKTAERDYAPDESVGV